MASIIPYKNGYRVRIYIAGRQHSRAVPNKRLANEWIKIKELEKLRVESGVDPHPEGKKPKLTFRKFSKEYLEWSRMHKAKTTYEVDKNSVKAILKKFGTTRMFDIRAVDIERYKKERFEKASSSTVNRELNCISHMLKIASDLEYIKKSNIKIKRLRVVRKSRPEFFTDIEVAKLLRCFTGPRQKAAILLGCDASLRKSEISRLKWEDIDFEKNVFNVRSEPGAHTKTYKGRIISMTKRLRKALDKLPRESKYVFATERGYIRDLRMTLEGTFRKARYDRPQIHKLRHTFGTRLARSGIDLYRISRLMGHTKDIKTTEIYAHLTADDLRVAIESINEA